MSDQEELLMLSAATSAATITLLAACRMKRRRKRAQRFWMRPLFQRRHQRGAYNTFMSELRQVDIEGGEMYSGFTRMNPEEFDFLLSLVNEDISEQPGFRLLIPADMKLAITLRYLATGRPKVIVVDMHPEFT